MGFEALDMRLDKRNILKLTPGLYLNPIKVYKQNGS